MEHICGNIEGFFDYNGFYSYIIGTEMPMKAEIVEIGAWKGASTAYLAVDIINSGKDIKLTVVDTWKGSNGLEIEAENAEVSIFDQFKANLKPVEGLLDMTFLQMPSVEAAKKFKNESLDFVFIDGNHDFQDVCDDIDAWLPKVKKGGIIAGHDYGTDPNVGFTGVNKAVNLKIKEFQLMGQVWYGRKH